MRNLLIKYLDVLDMIEKAGSNYYTLENARREAHEAINQALYKQCHDDVYDSMVEEIAKYLHDLPNKNIDQVVKDLEMIISSYSTRHLKRF